MTMQDIVPQTVRARELLGDFWFNSEPVPVTALRGQVVLLYFWDFGCAGCLRMLPYVAEWERRYSAFGLVTVGIHTPRFLFGKKPEHVQEALARYGIRFPVVMDNEALIALQYECRVLPEILLVDKDGFIRYRNAGDGNAAAIEQALQALLYSAGVGAVLPMIMEPLRETDRSGAICFRATPELYAGYLRGVSAMSRGMLPSPFSPTRIPVSIWTGGSMLMGTGAVNGNVSASRADRGVKGTCLRGTGGSMSRGFSSLKGRRRPRSPSGRITSSFPQTGGKTSGSTIAVGVTSSWTGRACTIL